ncbi:MAG: biotin carboxylase [Halobacteriovorax sp.]|nr:biotin carboxylase [Halobacteriovorax sp.]
MKLKLQKILIANRGEIALRVIRSCKELGIKTVTLYTDEEIDLPHALAGDESVCLGSGALSDTYLAQDRIIKICKDLNVDAIHPGYGFLSENAEFCRKVTAAGIKFIGPSPESMILMGDKTGSKRKMEEIKIPLIPGYHGDEQEPSFLKKEADKIGYPVLVKASAGGGGKGMRVVASSSEFLESLAAAKREAMNAFGDERVLIEKYIQNPRHIEIQVMSDQHGNHTHLFERECSIQRRHQKIVEESPSPALDQTLRTKMAEVAIRITSSINYEGAGTIEFILDGDIPGAFYFLEMNTRLQVEHPVTELVTGLDLVKLQIAVASGEKLPYTQADLVQRGHALELRIYAEDPDNGFLPSIGTIHQVAETSARLDTGYKDGNKVTISFDPMLAKLIVYGATRDEAIASALQALKETPFLGVTTNRDYLARILTHEKFVEGETFTHFVATYAESLTPKDAEDGEIALAVASHFLMNSSPKVVSNANNYSSWSYLTGFRL